MKFGVMFANTGFGASPDGAKAIAQAAEAGGFETLWTVEHVVVPSGYDSKYPYDPSGKMAGGAEAFDLPDPLIWLTWAAAHTERIRLGTGVLVLPQRNVVVTAKEVATLDHLSGGRVDARRRRRVAGRGVRRAGRAVRGAGRPDGRVHRRDARAVVAGRRRREVDRQGAVRHVRGLHHAAPPDQRHRPVRHRRALPHRRPPGRTARRRVLPRRRDDGGAGRAVRHRARRGRGRRARPRCHRAVQWRRAAGAEARRPHRAAGRDRRDPRRARRPPRPTSCPASAPTSSPSSGSAHLPVATRRRDGARTVPPTGHGRAAAGDG